MTPAQFIEAFPEFEQTRPTLVASRLTFALVKMGGPDVTVWPALATAGQQFSQTDLAQGFLAAHLLMTSPFGMEMRLTPTSGRTTYLDEFETIAFGLTGGFLVAGEGPGTMGGTTGATGALTLAPGAGTVAVTNGSTAITFSLVQSMPAGTVVVFVGAQPGALYAILNTTMSSNTAVLTAPYSGTTNPATSWNTGAG